MEDLSVAEFWVLPPEFKQSRVLPARSVLWSWLWLFVAYLQRLLGLSVGSSGPQSAPEVLRVWSNAKPSAWQLEANADSERAVLFLSGSHYEQSDRLCVRTLWNEDFAGTTMFVLPKQQQQQQRDLDAQQQIIDGRWCRLAWDPKGRHVAVAVDDAVHVVRVKKRGDVVQRATFYGVGSVCGVFLKAAEGSGLAVHVLSYDGVFSRISLPSGVNYSVFNVQDQQKKLVERVSVSEWVASPTAMAFHAQSSTVLVGGVSSGSVAGAVPAVSLFRVVSSGASNEFSVVHEWSSTRERSFAPSRANGKGVGCVVQAAFSPNGSYATVVMSTGACFLVHCNVEDPWCKPVTALTTAVTQVQWFDDQFIVAVDSASGHLSCVRVFAAGMSSSTPGGVVGSAANDEPHPLKTAAADKTFRGAQITSVAHGRFFMLTHRVTEKSATKITQEKLLKLKKEADMSQTFWGAVRSTLWSYLSYFSLPTFSTNAASGATMIRREELHNFVYFASFEPQQLVEKKMVEGDFEAALTVARKHGLALDDILKRRWHSVMRKALTPALIEDLLTPVSDKVWVVLQCLNAATRDSATELDHLLGFAAKICAAEEKDGMTLVFYALEMLVLEKRDRLKTYLEATSGAFDGADFEDFARQDLAVAAMVHAQNEQVGISRLLMVRHAAQVLPMRFAILSSIPESCPVAQLKGLLPRVEGNDEAAWDSRPWREEDANVQSVTSARAGLLVDLRKAVATTNALCDILGEDWHNFLKVLLFPKESVRFGGKVHIPVPVPASADHVSRWWLERVLSIDENAGSIKTALDMAALGEERGCRGLREVRIRLEEMSALCYGLRAAPTLTLKDYLQCSDYDVVVAFLGVLFDEKLRTLATLESALKHLRRFKKDEALIYRYIVHCASSEAMTPLCVFLLLHSITQQEPDRRALLDLDMIVRCTAEAARSSRSLAHVTSWLDLVRLLRSKPSLAGASAAEVNKLEAELSACECLQRLGVVMSVGDIVDATQKKNQHVVLQKIIVALGRKKRTSEATFWNDVARDLMSLRRSVLSDMSSEKLYCTLVALLVEQGHIQMAEKFIPDCGAEAESCVVEAASRVFDAANALDSEDVALVQAALDIVSSKHSLGGLCQAARVLSSLQVKAIPLQLRVWQSQTADDAFARVRAAVAAVDTEHRELAADEAAQLAVWLGVDSARGRELRVALAEADVNQGRIESAAAVALELGDASLAVKCILAKKPAKKISGSLLFRLCGVALWGSKDAVDVIASLQGLREFQDSEVGSLSAPTDDPVPLQHSLLPLQNSQSLLYDASNSGMYVARSRQLGYAQGAPLSDAALLTAAACSPREDALLYLSACSSPKVAALWLSARRRYATLLALASLFPNLHLDALVPPGARAEDEPDVVTPDPLLDEPLRKQGSKAASNNSNNNNNAEEDDIVSITKKAFKSFW